MDYVGHTFEDTMLTFKAIKLPVFYMAPNPRVEKRKTLIIVSGFDGTLEEEYFLRGYPAEDPPTGEALGAPPRMLFLRPGFGL